jgi:hypothetical protein
MTKIIMMFLSVMMLLSAGCAKEESDLKEERESLEKYADIFTLADLRRIVSYPGTIEKEVVKTPQAVHVNFYIRTKKYKKKAGDEIFILHIEHLMSSESELRNDMKTSEPVKGIGDSAWYESFDRGQSELIYYIADKKILVGLEGRNRGSDYPSSTLIDREGFIFLAKLIEDRL